MILDLTRQEEEESQNGVIPDQAEQISKSDLPHDNSGKKRLHMHMEREYHDLKRLVRRIASSRKLSCRNGSGALKIKYGE